MASPFVDYPTIIRHLETRLLVADLKDILKDIHLSTSGNKRPLIDRVTHHLNLLRSANDVARYTALKNKILRCGSASIPNFSMIRAAPVRSTFSNPPTAPQQSSPNGMPYGQFAGSSRPPSYYHPQQQQQQQTLNFRPSPFYEVVERLSIVATLPNSSRNTVSMSFVCSMNALDLLHQQSTKYRVAIMCADSTYAYNPNRQLLMEFPNPAEVQINGRKLHANLRGMKNKPGTIPPPDITPNVDKTPRLPNKIDITYSCGTDNSKKFGAQIVLLRTHSVDELVQRIRAGSTFTKESVLGKLRAPEDDDIEMASFDLTLKDPLSYMRITVPCRSTFCKHNQCWDAMAFLSINEQTPQWTCPICHVSISGLSSIAVDGYFQDILDNVGEDVDTILVDPQGNWKVPGLEKPEQDTAPKVEHQDLEILDLGDTEDEAESKAAAPALRHLKEEPASRGSTPITSVPPPKRKPLPVCIDLTEDSDDEPQPTKRVKQSDSLDAREAPHRVSPSTARTHIPELPSSAHAIPHQDPNQRVSSSNGNGDDRPWRLTHHHNGQHDQASPLVQRSNSYRDTAGTDSVLRNGAAAAALEQSNPFHAGTTNGSGENDQTLSDPAHRPTTANHDKDSFPDLASFADPDRSLAAFDGLDSFTTIRPQEQTLQEEHSGGYVPVQSPLETTYNERQDCLPGDSRVGGSPTERDRDPESPPIVVPGSYRTLVPSQPRIFSDDFSDGGDDY